MPKIGFIFIFFLGVYENDTFLKIHPLAASFCQIPVYGVISLGVLAKTDTFGSKDGKLMDILLCPLLDLTKNYISLTTFVKYVSIHRQKCVYTIGKCV